jgi:uncharacterized protein YlzI (FlbEa/FlbD family)
MKDRKISEEHITKTLTFPDTKISRENGGLEYKKNIVDRTVAVIIKKTERHENIIVSCWVNPPFPGTKDFRLRKRYLQMRNAHGFKKILYMILHKIGI